MAKLLPNIKVSVGNETEAMEEGEISESNTDESETEKETRKNVHVERSWLETLNVPKTHENKNGTFVTGLDLSSEVLMEKLNERAKRFGLENSESTPVTQNEIDALYKSLNIDAEIFPAAFKNVRFEVLHMRGVNEMDNDDIFSYFKNYGPAKIEWINDLSCNIVWLDKSTAARALIGVSQPLDMKRESKQISSESQVVESSDDEEPKIADLNQNYDEDRNANDLNLMSLNEMDAPVEYGNISTEKDSVNLDIPIPPGSWRLGISHPKAKAILLRFATKDDKKLRGAANRSQYYQKYGNPNYGGIKGLISTSKKRKLLAAKNKLSIDKILSEHETDADVPQSSAPRTNRTKPVRMKMYADEEEERRRGSFGPSFQHKNIHNRLGTKYSADDLLQFGRQRLDESDTEDTVEVNCTIPSRFGIWNDLAMQMSEEDYVPPKENFRKLSSFTSRASQKVDLRSSLNLKSSHQNPRFGIGSDSRKRLSEYRHGEDLRSKIARMKNDESVKKHRSPLLKDD